MDFTGIKTQYKLYKNEIDHAIQQVLESGQFIMGKQINELEKTLAEFVKVKHVITVSSGTDSLLIALMALNVGPGDEVITVPFTWISPSEVIALLGARPVFVDIDPQTYNMDSEKLEKAITPKTKAIMPVSLFGQMADYTSINQVARKHNIPVIEDGAQSFGATHYGQASCSLTSIGSTSFFPSKTLGCYGDGGALFTNDDALAQKMRAIRTHGCEVRHHHHYIGLNGRLDTIQAAILLVKLRYLSQELKLREQVGSRYTKKLKNDYLTPHSLKENTHVYSQYTIRLKNRDVVSQALEKEGIPTQIYYPKCIHLQPAFQYLGLKEKSFPVAEQASHEVLSLPMHPWITEKDQDLIVEIIKSKL
jgi:UDP-2-acetamido-2-deoxy-ribo-hexuluronate aminotransferase